MHKHTCQHTLKNSNNNNNKKTTNHYVPSAKNFLIDCNPMLGLNITLLINYFQSRMEHDVIQFKPYLDVFLIDTSSNTFSAPLPLWLC